MCRVRQVVVKVYDVFGRGHDETAGAKPDTSPVDRTIVNVGTICVRSRAIGIGTLPAEGRRWGGAVVVLRDRESRSHGEGRQREEATHEKERDCDV